MINQKNIQGQILGVLFLLVLLTSSAYASGVAMPYWDTHPLYMSRGETKTIEVELQNLVGNSSTTFKVSISSTNDIAKLVDRESSYFLAAGERKSIPLTITVPNEANYGGSYTVTVSAQENKVTEPGQFILGSAFDNSFKVIVSAPSVNKPETRGTFSSNSVLLVLGILIVIIIIVIWFKRKRR